MRLTILPVLVFYGVMSFAVATPLQNTTLKHSWDNIPRGWSFEATPDPDHTFDLHIGLTQNRVQDLIHHLMEVSDPTHPRYGQHLSKDEAEALVESDPASLNHTTSWLESHGISPSRITHRKSGGDWLTLRVSVSEAEQILNTQYSIYRRAASEERVLRSLSYSVPVSLKPHIDVITPTTYFSTMQSMRATSFLQPESDPAEDIDALVGPIFEDVPIPMGCSTTVTPACLRALYNTSSYVPVSMGQNQLGVAGYLEEYANRADLQTFLKKFRSDATNASFPTVTINGGHDDQTKPGIEANLDIQYTIGMSYPTPNIYYSTGGSPPFTQDSETPTNTNEPYLDWITGILSQDTIPQVITTSYGDDEQTVPVEYATRICNMFAQLGVRGITLFFSSGDFGVGGGDCRTNDGTDRILFQPAFPASCPYVTAVGGTTRINPEVGVSFSGGGFSRYFSQPTYQSTAVSGYLAHLGSQHSDFYNPTGRAYPDLSAQANRFQVIIGGRLMSVGGTSASSPTVAGIFSLLNDYRLAQSLPPLGFLNPLIYSLSNQTRTTTGNDTSSPGFNDIVSGSNPGCGTNGFAAVEGWDPITGLGTPDFGKLQDLVS
ncbi:subtilisin-like protein [Ephemerocybe angulata]|uniref:tripeptidyl-peptidase II n=1 Tax=Ephemerocybe angulata TaxID=980116 RepID=A0A8H6HWE5_9AGAR|nr:subtilisin-like protein [Tulosesus angulatus]